MLILGVAHWPYGYYMLLRVVVMATALLLVGQIYQRVKRYTVWIGLFLIIAFLFNPLFPLHMTRSAWSILNLAGAAIFVWHFFVERRGLAC